MLLKTPYLTPHCETIELASKAALMTASNEGYPVVPVAPFSEPFSSPGGFDEDLISFFNN